MADALERLRRASTMAKTPEDRAWAAARYKELSGGEAPGDAPAAAPSLAPMSLMDSAMADRTSSALKAKGVTSVNDLTDGGEGPSLPEGFTPDIQAQIRGAGQMLPLIGPHTDEITAGIRAGVDKVGGAIGASPPVDLMDAYHSRLKSERDQNKAAAERDPASYYTAGGMSSLIGGGALAPKGLVSGALMGGNIGLGMSEADLTKGEFGQAGEDAAKGAGVGLAAAAIPAVISGARKGAQAISPWVRKAAEADASGAMEAAQALPRGREGVVRATEGARDQILARDAALMGHAGEQYQSVVGPSENMPANVKAIHDAIDEMRMQNRMPSSGQPIDEHLESSLMSLKDKVSPPGEQGPATASHADMLRLRRSLKQASGFGNASPTDAQLTSRGKYDAINQGVHSASPEIAAADDAYSQAAANSEDVHQILGQSSGGPIVGREPMRRAAAQLEYMGDESMPALQREPELSALAAKDPEYAKSLKQLEAKKALEATRLFTTEPGVRSSISPALGQLPLIGGTAKLAQQYGRGALRLTDRALGASQGAAQMSPRAAMSLLDLILQQREQEQSK